MQAPVSPGSRDHVSQGNGDPFGSVLEDVQQQRPAPLAPATRNLGGHRQLGAVGAGRGLPDRLRAGIERLSGLSMGDVTVHRNSAEPAQVQALAFTLGTEIHIGPGQEQHLGHEAWHVAQQKQGRVKPTINVGGVEVNDDRSLEREADVMGARALRGGTPPDGSRPLADTTSRAPDTTKWKSSGGTAQRAVVQRTTVGEVLDTYFSPLSTERVWVMEQNDPYTVLVRAWQPVIDAEALLLSDLQNNPQAWTTNHQTTPTWRPGAGFNHDPNAKQGPVPSPPGTDPDTCREGFIIYASGEAVRLGLGGPFGRLLPRIETLSLSRCAIGSFTLLATVDSIDVATGTATVNIWMYNAMTRQSFGPFANHPAFSLSGQEPQFMWWHWRTSHRWTPPPPPPAPSPPAPSPPIADLLFDNDSATLTIQAMTQLTAALPQIQSAPSIKLFGHTDSRGDDTYNQGLSDRRAEAVRNAIVAMDPTLAGRIHRDGLSEHNPVGSNATPAGRQRNRRVELRLGP